jgi:hypothetical protein
MNSMMASTACSALQGLVVAVLVLSLIHISGCHLNLLPILDWYQGFF